MHTYYEFDGVKFEIVLVNYLMGLYQLAKGNCRNHIHIDCS